jgi:hypothetical protein
MEYRIRPLRSGAGNTDNRPQQMHTLAQLSKGTNLEVRKQCRDALRADQGWAILEAVRRPTAGPRQPGTGSQGTEQIEFLVFYAPQSHVSQRSRIT